MGDLSGKIFFEDLYKGFSKPLDDVDCGEKCGPYNNYGVPFCCDIQFLVPAAYIEEWIYLQRSTNLWQLYQDDQAKAPAYLQEGLQSGQVLIKCLGYKRCQRPYRSITCRAFPFYPYINRSGKFSGLAYYRDFREQCWIINNLDVVGQDYKEEFQSAFQMLFELNPDTKKEFMEFSEYMREETIKAGESLVFMDFLGQFYQVDPRTEELTKTTADNLDSFGPYKIAKEMVFPDEMKGSTPGKQHG